MCWIDNSRCHHPIAHGSRTSRTSEPKKGGCILPAVMDLFSRRIVGWNTADRIDRRFALMALEEALRRRRPEPGLVHHSDQGCQYASYDYQQRLRKAQAISSMSRRGNCCDNAAMESFFSSLKRERVHRRKYWTREEAAEDIKDYIERFYNTWRRHSHSDQARPTPVACERTRCTQAEVEYP